MKKIYLFQAAVLALLLVLPAAAQVNLGLLGGVNIANIRQDPQTEEDVEHRIGIGIGGVIDFNINKSVALLFEPMYLQKGAKADEKRVNGKSVLKLAYMEFPALLKLSMPANETKPYITAGPTIGFNLAAKAKFTEGDYSEEEDVQEYIKTVDFGVGFGAGVSLPIGNNSFFIEARYALGLTTINDFPEEQEYDVGEEPEIDNKNRGIQIFAGITIPID